MKNILRLTGLFAVLSLPLLLAGCGRDSGRNLVAPETGSATTIKQAQVDSNDPAFLGALLPISRILFVHASPDAPAVDIYYGIRQVANGLSFPQNTPYRYVLSGKRTVRVNVDNTSTTVIGAPVRLAPRTFYSVFAVNTVASIEPLVLVDDLTPPATGKAHVRFVHLSPNAPAVDVALAGGGPVVFGNKSFKEATAFTPLGAGTYNLEVRLAGTNTVVLPLPGITLKAGTIYTVFAKGLVGGPAGQELGAQIIVNSVARSYYESLATAREVGPEQR